MCFATDHYTVDWRDEDAISFLALQTLTAEKNNFEHEQALEQQEEYEQQRKWQTPS